MSDPVLNGIQTRLDELDEGWAVSDYVLIVGAQRIGIEGAVEQFLWLFTAPDQPGYTTTGLLCAADEILSKDITEESE